MLSSSAMRFVVSLASTTDLNFSLGRLELARDLNQRNQWRGSPGLLAGVHPPPRDRAPP
jgi:hypothetical protein